MKAIINCGLTHKWLVAYFLMFILPAGYLLYVIKGLADELALLHGANAMMRMSLLIGIPAAMLMSFSAFVLVSRSARKLKQSSQAAENLIHSIRPERAPRENESMDEAEKISSYVTEMIEALQGKLMDVDRYAQDLKTANKKLVEIAVNDGLTGLFNHKHAMHTLRIELERAIRFSHPLSICMIDIDEFKKFNDTHGHPVGDKALARVGQILLDNIRTVDIAARYGGEEFMVIIPETMPTDTMEVAERIRRAVETSAFDVGGGKSVRMTVSVGISAYMGVIMTPEELVASADKNLYKAKRTGKNKVCLWTEEQIQVPALSA
ncbi:MAG: GGDEF domain-containing protein [Verrucomicrobia bacterium]|nr:GGDEF domain-containing protein [Verrucomicrobiota bacterium]